MATLAALVYLNSDEAIKTVWPSTALIVVTGSPEADNVKFIVSLNDVPLLAVYIASNENSFCRFGSSVPIEVINPAVFIWKNWKSSGSSAELQGCILQSNYLLMQIHSGSEEYHDLFLLNLLH